METVTETDRSTPRCVLVTGPSGAGRQTAVHALEDLGWEAIDNLPLTLVPKVVDGEPLARPLALGIDVRNREFSTARLLDLIDELSRLPGLDLTVLYLDAAEPVLVQRYSETRRRHPAAPAEAPIVGIRREIELLAPIRDRADHLIDTSDLTPHDLKAEMARWFGDGDAGGLGITVQSFSYKRGIPRGLDLVFDCRFLRNPHWDPALRPLDGRSAEVASYVADDPAYEGFRSRLLGLLGFLLPAYRQEGKAHLSIGFGCTGGQHRSVHVAEIVAEALEAEGWRVSKRHRELGARPVGSMVAGRDNGRDAQP